MNSYLLTKNTTSYKEAVKATEQIEPPALGFIKPSEFQGPTSGSSAIIKQNNTQIQLLTQIAESLTGIQADLKVIIAQSRGGTTSNLLPEDLIQKLQNLSITPSTKLKEGRGKLRVFKDPYKILEAEQEKLKQ